MAEIQYQRLARARLRSWVGLIVPFRSSLWLSADHLLRLDSSGFSETYKRFYYRDIQAILVRRTNHWKVFAGICAGLAGFLAFLAVLSVTDDSAIGAWIYGVLGGCCLAMCLLTLAGGPSCACQIRTAVQTEDLPSLNTVRRARQALEELRPRIAAAQGRLTPEELPARLAVLRAAALPAGAPAVPAPPDPSLPPIIAPDA